MMSLGRAALVALGLIGALAAGAAAAVPPYDPGKIYPTEEAFARSIKVYQDAVAANGHDAQAAYWLGFAYWQAWGFHSTNVIPYGADYLDRAIESLERTVGIDDKNLSAWSILLEAYEARGAAGDGDKHAVAEQRVVELSYDPAATNRGIPPTRKRGGTIPMTFVTPPHRVAQAHYAGLPAMAGADTTSAPLHASRPVIAAPAAACAAG